MKGYVMQSLGGILFLLFFQLVAFAQPVGPASVRQYGKGSPFQIGDLPPGHLRSALYALPAAAQTRAVANLHRFSFPRQDVDHLRVNKYGGIFYICNLGVDAATEGNPDTAEGAPSLSFDPGKAFLLHSRPGAPNKVFLNFQGGTISGTAWNSAATMLSALPYDTDANPAVFSDAERRAIADV